MTFTTTPLTTTPLHRTHRAAGARMVDFGGKLLKAGVVKLPFVRNGKILAS